LGDARHRGDLFAHVKLVLPDELTDDEITALRQLAERRGGQSSVKHNA